MDARILLGIPSGGSVKTKTMMSIIQVLFQTQAEITLVEREGALGPDNRNHLAQMALDGGHTHLFLVDADMSFPGDTLTRLLELLWEDKSTGDEDDNYIFTSQYSGMGTSNTVTWEHYIDHLRL